MKMRTFTFMCMVITALMMATSVVLAEEGDPETIIECRQAGSTFGPYTSWAQVTLGPEAVAVNPDHAAYTWCRYISGDQACLYTAGDAGGRDCGPGHRNCGFFLRGYAAWGVSGKACVSAGISQCQGWCW